MQDQNPYQFITDAPKQTKQPLGGLGGSTKGRILIVGGAAALLLIIGIIVASILSSAGKAGQTEALRAAQQQTELIRISDIGAQRAKGTSAKNLAASVSVSIKSDQATLLATMKANGQKVSTKQLALGKNQKTDALLTSAEQSNRFDDVFIETMQKELTDYQKTLKAAFDKTESKKVKAELSNQFNAAGLLAGAKQ